MKIIEIPGSKSLTNRALIMASLANGVSTIRNFSKSDDSTVLIKALKKFGIKITTKKDSLFIIGNGGKFNPFDGIIEAGNAGTAMRFLTALSVLIPGKIEIKSSKRLSERPIKELKIALRKVKTGSISIRGDISSQFISALLMIAPVLNKGLVIKIKGELVSRSYVDMTVHLMDRFGVKVINSGNKKLVVKDRQSYKAVNYVVDGDASGASYFWSIAAITKQTIRVKNVNPESMQGDIKFPEILRKMGCSIKKNSMENWVEITGPKILKGINVNMILMPDTAQSLAVVAAFAKGKTTITGLKTLKIKETDRLLALKNELKKLGIKSQITNDSIIVYGGNPKPAEIETYNDHRMAMAFAIAKARLPDIKIKNPEVVKKSFPSFWEMFNQL